MTRDDIISLAKEAGFQTDMFGLGIWDSSEFNKFANLVAAAEREECAKICDAAQLFGNIDERWSAKCCSEAIRARGQV